MTCDQWKTTPPWDLQKEPKCAACEDAGCQECCDVGAATGADRIAMDEALAADGEYLRQLTMENHGPFCPRCIEKPLGPKPIFLGPEGHICGECWEQDRAAEARPGDEEHNALP